ncbi:hypothetical protein SLEP1_g38031 [Rubroshorea leprosula]|uniref:Uncharacterized protein n=1 Tax=Rubroshorea leprosula TaxID=152421 RepID=A0AAV5KWJ9_9ROSI|nr:hypothetical protein SLEP1_g38031 [Rubroshorea leprosula]
MPDKEGTDVIFHLEFSLVASLTDNGEEQGNSSIPSSYGMQEVL